MITNLTNVPVTTPVQDVPQGEVLVSSGDVYMVTEARANVPVGNVPVANLSTGQLTSIPSGTSVSAVVSGSYSGTL